MRHGLGRALTLQDTRFGGNRERSTRARSSEGFCLELINVTRPVHSNLLGSHFKILGNRCESDLKLPVLRGDHRLFDAGKFELIVMLVLALLSFAGAPVYIVLGGAALLAISTLHEYAHLQPRFARAGATRLMAGGVLLTALTSLAFASLCYAIGRFFAWLIAT